jgi:hypothetical protein
MQEAFDDSNIVRLSIRRAGPLTGASLYLKPCAAGRLTRFQKIINLKKRFKNDHTKRPQPKLGLASVGGITENAVL